MRIFENRWDDERVRRIAVRTAGAVHVTALEAAPAEVDGTPPPGIDRAVVDLLPGILADVADVQRAGHPVEREAPGVAQPIRPDLRPRGRLADERVVGRHCVRVRPALARIDPDEL